MDDKIKRITGILILSAFAAVTFSIAIAQAVFFLALTLTLACYIRNNEFSRLTDKIKSVELNSPLIIFFLAAILSLIFYNAPVEPIKCAKKLKFFLLFLAYYYFVIDRPTLLKSKRCIHALLGGFSLTLVYILLQHYLGKDMLPYRYDTFFWESGTRIYPLYGQFASIIVMIFLPVLLFDKKATRNEKLLYALITVPIAMTLYYSSSRSAIISVIISFAVMLYMNKKKLHLLVTLIIILVSIGVYTQRGDNNLVNSIIDITDPASLRFESNISRIEMINDTVNILRDDPLTGIGFYGYKYYTKGRKIGHAKISNDLLNVVATMGLLGVIPFIWILTILFRESYRVIKLKKSEQKDDDSLYYLSLGIFLAFISFLINGLFEPIFFNSKGLLLMLLLLSLNRSRAGARPPFRDSSSNASTFNA